MFVTCDGKEIVDWKGDAGRLSLVDGWKVPEKGQLFLGGWKGGTFRITGIGLLPLGD